jgi:hypothetical protein
MSAALLRRIERLERRKATGPVWQDPIDAVMRILGAFEAVWAAERADRAYSMLPAPTLSAEAEQRVALATRDYDRIVERIRAPKPA